MIKCILMIDVKIIINSNIEEVLGVKCCNLPDQNTEMHIRNIGDRPIIISGHFKLENEKETMECNNLFPPWEQKIAPGEVVAFYCSMDPFGWERCHTLTVFDKKGSAYRFSIKEIADHSTTRYFHAARP